jgi:SET domain-containing protein
VQAVAAISEVTVRASPIEGLGVFAAQAFRAGERIRKVNVVRDVTAETPLREDLGERQDHCDYPDGRVVLLGFPDRHVNHSCDPSAYVLYEGTASYLVARRRVGTGEEITCDYSINLSGGSSWPCHCGTLRCRGQVCGDFFSLPGDLQREYRPLLADWFVRRHHERIAALDAA